MRERERERERLRERGKKTVKKEDREKIKVYGMRVKKGNRERTERVKMKTYNNPEENFLRVVASGGKTLIPSSHPTFKIIRKTYFSKITNSLTHR